MTVAIIIRTFWVITIPARQSSLLNCSVRRAGQVSRVVALVRNCGAEAVEVRSRRPETAPGFVATLQPSTQFANAVNRRFWPQTMNHGQHGSTLRPADKPHEFPGDQLCIDRRPQGPGCGSLVFWGFGFRA